ncbi:hypothetical protein PFAG_04462 [Plasmodium falciparum Santa Lucia]|uniref:Protein kinase domain-containing protein n=1 Tax=Plasmodium falciparum Santa Lucia TaxID=478859 RepID=W7FKX1_PLAFA|nr:hypothetical protein PFAG_04462 [Plasmodium falciparum Santa Lucia]
MNFFLFFRNIFLLNTIIFILNQYIKRKDYGFRFFIFSLKIKSSKEEFTKNVHRKATNTKEDKSAYKNEKKEIPYRNNNKRKDKNKKGNDNKKILEKGLKDTNSNIKSSTSSNTISNVSSKLSDNSNISNTFTNIKIQKLKDKHNKKNSDIKNVSTDKKKENDNNKKNNKKIPIIYIPFNDIKNSPYIRGKLKLVYVKSFYEECQKELYEAKFQFFKNNKIYISTFAVVKNTLSENIDQTEKWVTADMKILQKNSYNISVTCNDSHEKQIQDISFTKQEKEEFELMRKSLKNVVNITYDHFLYNIDTFYNAKRKYLEYINFFFRNPHIKSNMDIKKNISSNITIQKDNILLKRLGSFNKTKYILFRRMQRNNRIMCMVLTDPKRLENRFILYNMLRDHIIEKEGFKDVIIFETDDNNIYNYDSKLSKDIRILSNKFEFEILMDEHAYINKPYEYFYLNKYIPVHFELQNKGIINYNNIFSWLCEHFINNSQYKYYYPHFYLSKHSDKNDMGIRNISFYQKEDAYTFIENNKKNINKNDKCKTYDTCEKDDTYRTDKKSKLKNINRIYNTKYALSKKKNRNHKNNEINNICSHKKEEKHMFNNYNISYNNMKYINKHNKFSFLELKEKLKSDNNEREDKKKKDESFEKNETHLMNNDDNNIGDDEFNSEVNNDNNGSYESNFFYDMINEISNKIENSDSYLNEEDIYWDDDIFFDTNEYIDDTSTITTSTNNNNIRTDQNGDNKKDDSNKDIISIQKVNDSTEVNESNKIDDTKKGESYTLNNIKGYITKFKDFIQNKSESYVTTKNKSIDDKSSDDQISDDKINDDKSSVDQISDDKNQISDDKINDDKSSVDQISDDKSSDDIKLNEEQTSGDQNDLSDNNENNQETITSDDTLEKGKLDNSNMGDSDEKLKDDMKNNEHENLSAENDKNSDDKSSDDIKLNEEQTSGDQNDLYDNNKEKEKIIFSDGTLEKGNLDKSNMSDSEGKLDGNHMKNNEDGNLSAENVSSDEKKIYDKSKDDIFLDDKLKGNHFLDDKLKGENFIVDNLSYNSNFYSRKKSFSTDNLATVKKASPGEYLSDDEQSENDSIFRSLEDSSFDNEIGSFYQRRPEGYFSNDKMYDSDDESLPKPQTNDLLALKGKPKHEDISPSGEELQYDTCSTHSNISDVHSEPIISQRDRNFQDVTIQNNINSNSKETQSVGDDIKTYDIHENSNKSNFVIDEDKKNGKEEDLNTYKSLSFLPKKMVVGQIVQEWEDMFIIDWLLGDDIFCVIKLEFFDKSINKKIEMEYLKVLNGFTLVDNKKLPIIHTGKKELTVKANIFPYYSDIRFFYHNENIDNSVVHTYNNEIFENELKSYLLLVHHLINARNSPCRNYKNVKYFYNEDTFNLSHINFISNKMLSITYECALQVLNWEIPYGIVKKNDNCISKFVFNNLQHKINKDIYPYAIQIKKLDINNSIDFAMDNREFIQNYVDLKYDILLKTSSKLFTLHTLGLVHSNIKADNFLIEYLNKEYYELYIYLKNFNNIVEEGKCNNFKGSSVYMAPEKLKTYFYHIVNKFKSDVFSLGLSLSTVLIENGFFLKSAAKRKISLSLDKYALNIIKRNPMVYLWIKSSNPFKKKRFDKSKHRSYKKVSVHIMEKLLSNKYVYKWIHNRSPSFDYAQAEKHMQLLEKHVPQQFITKESNIKINKIEDNKNVYNQNIQNKITYDKNMEQTSEKHNITMNKKRERVNFVDACTVHSEDTKKNQDTFNFPSKKKHVYLLDKEKKDYDSTLGMNIEVSFSQLSTISDHSTKQNNVINKNDIKENSGDIKENSEKTEPIKRKGILKKSPSDSNSENDLKDLINRIKMKYFNESCRNIKNSIVGTIMKIFSIEYEKYRPDIFDIYSLIKKDITYIKDKDDNVKNLLTILQKIREPDMVSILKQKINGSDYIMYKMVILKALLFYGYFTLYERLSYEFKIYEHQIFPLRENNEDTFGTIIERCMHRFNFNEWSNLLIVQHIYNNYMSKKKYTNLYINLHILNIKPNDEKKKEMEELYDKHMTEVFKDIDYNDNVNNFLLYMKKESEDISNTLKEKNNMKTGWDNFHINYDDIYDKHDEKDLSLIRKTILKLDNSVIRDMNINLAILLNDMFWKHKNRCKGVNYNHMKVKYADNTIKEFNIQKNPIIDLHKPIGSIVKGLIKNDDIMISKGHTNINTLDYIIPINIHLDVILQNSLHFVYTSTLIKCAEKMDKKGIIYHRDITYNRKKETIKIKIGLISNSYFYLNVDISYLRYHEITLKDIIYFIYRNYKSELNKSVRSNIEKRSFLFFDCLLVNEYNTFFYNNSTKKLIKETSFNKLISQLYNINLNDPEYIIKSTINYYNHRKSNMPLISLVTISHTIHERWNGIKKQTDYILQPSINNYSDEYNEELIDPSKLKFKNPSLNIKENMNRIIMRNRYEGYQYRLVKCFDFLHKKNISYYKDQHTTNLFDQIIIPAVFIHLKNDDISKINIKLALEHRKIKFNIITDIMNLQIYENQIFTLTDFMYLIFRWLETYISFNDRDHCTFLTDRTQISQYDLVLSIETGKDKINILYKNNEGVIKFIFQNILKNHQVNQYTSEFLMSAIKLNKLKLFFVLKDELKYIFPDIPEGLYFHLKESNYKIINCLKYLDGKNVKLLENNIYDDSYVPVKIKFMNVTVIYRIKKDNFKNIIYNFTKYEVLKHYGKQLFTRFISPINDIENKFRYLFLRDLSYYIDIPRDIKRDKDDFMVSMDSNVYNALNEKHNIYMNNYSSIIEKMITYMNVTYTEPVFIVCVVKHTVLGSKIQLLLREMKYNITS